MHYELNKKEKETSFKTRLILVIIGIVLFVAFLGIIIWTSIELNKIPATYDKGSKYYKSALIFGIVNGFSDFIALILFVNITTFSYSAKLFNKIQIHKKKKIKKTNSFEIINQEGDECSKNNLSQNIQFEINTIENDIENKNNKEVA